MSREPEVLHDFSSFREAPITSREVHRFAALSQLSHAEKNLGKPLGPARAGFQRPGATRRDDIARKYRQAVDFRGCQIWNNNPCT